LAYIEMGVDTQTDTQTDGQLFFYIIDSVAKFIAGRQLYLDPYCHDLSLIT